MCIDNTRGKGVITYLSHGHHNNQRFTSDVLVYAMVILRCQSLCQKAGKENQKCFANIDADDEDFRSPKKKRSQKKSSSERFGSKTSETEISEITKGYTPAKHQLGLDRIQRLESSQGTAVIR